MGRESGAVRWLLGLGLSPRLHTRVQYLGWKNPTARAETATATWASFFFSLSLSLHLSPCLGLSLS